MAPQSKTTISDALREALKEVDPKTGKTRGEGLLEAVEQQASKPTAKGKKFAKLLPSARRIAEQSKRSPKKGRP